MTTNSTTEVEQIPSAQELATEMAQNPIEQYQVQLDRHRDYFARGETKTYEWRIGQLDALKKLITKHQSDIQQALKQDLGKCKTEATFTEITATLAEIKTARSQLKKWMKPRRVSSPMAAQPASSYVRYEPLGVALIIGAWNYPFHLTLAPLIGAICAGCCAIIKPSEVAAETSKLIAKLVPDYLDGQAYSVVEGGKDETTELLALCFDKIFYTGGEHVGKVVMSAAAKHLTPVTLELGGKSPCVVDAHTNIEITARRIVWGKFMNVGQTCIAPDYVLVEQSVKQQLIEAIQRQIEQQYGKSPKTNEDYGRIINRRHCQRLAGYLVDQEVIFGGEIDIEDRYMSPTLVLNPAPDSVLMQEEIFGPILPIISLPSRQHMLDFVSARPHPLAAYLFSEDKAFYPEFERRITAGNICINDISMFMLNHKLPFGGVGTSGMGAYHGKYSLQAFSYRKSVMSRSFKLENSLRYAPFSKFKAWMLRRFI